MNKGIFFTGLEKVAVYGITFVQGVALARLLSPEDFGLTAMLGIFLCLGAILAEGGLGTAMVVFDAERHWRRVLCWNVGLALAIYAILAAFAPAIARWYGKPVLAPLMRVMAAGLVINAAGVVTNARLTRDERFGCLAWANGASTIAAACVAILMAWHGWGVWSIAWAGLFGAAVRTGMLCFFNTTPSTSTSPSTSPSPSFSDLLSYGLKLTASGIIHVIYVESYILIIGKMWSPAAVGLFVRGKRWAELPGGIVNETIGRVALPALAKEKVEKVGGGGVGRFLILNMALLWPCLIVLGVWTPEIIGFVLGEKWLDCVPYLRILLVGQFFWVFGNIALVKIRASGHSETILKTDAWKKPIGFVSLACGIPFGVSGLCWAAVADSIVEAVVDVVYAVRAR